MSAFTLQERLHGRKATLLPVADRIFHMPVTVYGEQVTGTPTTESKILERPVILQM